MVISEASLGSDCLELSFWAFIFKHPDLKILQKYQSLSNQSFKHNLAHIPSLNLTPTRSFEPRFRYDRKSKRLYPWTSCSSLLCMSKKEHL